MPFARWVTERLPRVGDRIYHRSFRWTGIEGRMIEEHSHGWGRVVKRLGDPMGMLCMVRFDRPISTAGERRNWKPRIVWNYDCWHNPEQRYPVTGTEEE